MTGRQLRHPTLRSPNPCPFTHPHKEAPRRADTEPRPPSQWRNLATKISLSLQHPSSAKWPSNYTHLRGLSRKHASRPPATWKRISQDRLLSSTLQAIASLPDTKQERNRATSCFGPGATDDTPLLGEKGRKIDGNRRSLSQQRMARLLSHRDPIDCNNTTRRMANVKKRTQGE